MKEVAFLVRIGYSNGYVSILESALQNHELEFIALEAHDRYRHRPNSSKLGMYISR